MLLGETDAIKRREIAICYHEKSIAWGTVMKRMDSIVMSMERGLHFLSFKELGHRVLLLITLVKSLCESGNISESMIEKLEIAFQ